MALFLRHRVLVALILALALVSAACGDSDDDDSGTAGGTTEAPSTETSSEDTSADTTAAPTTAAAATATSAAAGGGSQRELLVIGQSTEPDTMDDYIGEVRWENAQVMDAMVHRELDGTLVPHLAAEMPTPVDEAGTTWEIKLREGVMWHDGTPFDAASVVESANHLTSLEGIQEVLGSAAFDLMESIEAVDDMTVRLTYTTAVPLFPLHMAYWRLQKAHPDVAEHPIGTGPYRFVQWDRGSRVVLEANEDYWGDPPTVDRIEFVVIPDPAARVAALQTGEVDIIADINVEDEANVPNFIEGESIQFYRLQFNARDGVTADPRVRQALNMAIDKDALNEAFFGGSAMIDQCQSLAPSYVGYNDSLSAYPYDPEQARQLISEAGAEGAEISLMGAADRWPKQEEILEAIGAMWGEVGITANLEIVPFEEWLKRSQTQPAPRPDSFFVGASIRTFDADSLAGYVISDPERGRISSVTDPEIDAMIEAAEPIIDLDERQAAWEPFVARVCEQAYFGHLFLAPVFYGTVEGIDFTPDPRLRWTRVQDMTFS